jgi:Pvc16 N-terminal domain
MSSFQAIAGVSSTLKRLLGDRVDSPPGLLPALHPVPVSVGTPPDEPDAEEAPQLNLFLYRVTENGYLANQEIPGRGQEGKAYGHPPLSLNLHYLLTPYGSTKTDAHPPLVDDFIAHYLLGSAMRVLHDFAIITDTLETSGGLQILDQSLRDEYERVKLTLEPLTLEDTAKVWTALTRPFRLSAAYEVSVVQIEAELPRRFPLPVGSLPKGGARVKAIAARAPHIDEVHAAGEPSPMVRIGDTLVLVGTDLDGDPTMAWFGTLDVSGSIASADRERVTIVVPDVPGLQPGIQGVHVAHGVQLGEPPAPHVGPHSNSAAFVLVPTLSNATVAGGNLTLEGVRLIAPDVECMSLVGPFVVHASSYAVGATPTKIVFPVPAGAVSGSRIRVRVNGAESLEEVRLP